MNALRLIPRTLESIFARVDGQLINSGEFIGDVLACAEELPTATHCINLCNNRYAFMVVFFAAIARGQTNLLPAKRTASALAQLREHYPACYQIGDTDNQFIDQRYTAKPASNGSEQSPEISADVQAAIAFTSGSTGTPQAHTKSWRMLSAFRQWHWQRLAGTQHQTQHPHWGLVATVPAWHMYGLEWAMMMPSAAPITVHCGADFFPADVVAALNEFNQPDPRANTSAKAPDVGTLLVATPTHLNSLLSSQAPQAPVTTTICATAPLTSELCLQVSKTLNTRVLEIYGCSEIGTLAWRRRATAQAAANGLAAEPDGWQFFDGFDVTQNLPSRPAATALADTDNTGCELCISTEFLSEPVVLGDRFLAQTDNKYQLLGRATDMVKVAGKRESLAHLNSVLTNIAGVEDGLLYDPASFGQPNKSRLAALVVAPTLTERQLRKALAAIIDPAFVPRPIRFVAQLPRAATGKLPKQAVAQLLRTLVQQDTSIGVPHG